MASAATAATDSPQHMAPAATTATDSPQHMASAATTAADSPQRIAIGMIFILLSGMLFALMSALTRIVTDNGMPAMQIVFVSGVVRWIGLASIMIRAGEDPAGSSAVRPLLILRSLCGMTAFSCATFGFGVLPLGNATTIFLTSPFWAALLARIVLKEELHPVDGATILLALTGVVLVARPEALFSGGRDEEGGDVHPHDQQSSSEAWGVVVVMAGAAFAGCVAVLVRLIKKRGNLHPAVIAHAYAFITVIVSPLGFLLANQQPRWTHLNDPALTWLLCCTIGLLAIPNQLLVNAGALEPAS